MQWVEITIAEQTSGKTKTFADQYIEDPQNTPITNQGFPGFASSQFGTIFSVEVIASIPNINETIRLDYNMLMRPREPVDYTGMGTNAGVLEYLAEELGSRFRP